MLNRYKKPMFITVCITLLLTLLSVFMVRSTTNTKFEQVGASTTEIATSIDSLKKQTAKSVTDTKTATIYVLYKPTCPICQKYQKDILKQLQSLEETKTSMYNIIYVDVTDGIPSDLESIVSYESIQGAKTPYIIELRSDLYSGDKSDLGNIKYTAIVAGRVDSSSDVQNLKKLLIDGAEKSVSEINASSITRF